MKTEKEMEGKGLRFGIRIVRTEDNSTALDISQIVVRIEVVTNLS